MERSIGGAEELRKHFEKHEPSALKVAEVRFGDRDHRFVEDGPVRDHFYETLGRVRDLLASEASLPRPVFLRDADRRAELAEALGRLSDERPRSEARFRELGVEPPYVMALAQVLGIFRADYLALVDSVEPAIDFQPRYLNIGPGGRCNLLCPTCILGGALRRHRTDRALLMPEIRDHLRWAEELGATQLSLCIGEPTMDPDLLADTLEVVRGSSGLEVRSFITNGLFAKKLEGGRRLWRRVLKALGREKAVKCIFAFSANEELEGQGVKPETTANAIQTFVEVMPNRVCALQCIRGEAWREYRARVLAFLEERDLVVGEVETGNGDALAPPVKLVGGFTLVTTVMAKFPAVNTPAEDIDDPYIFTLRDIVPDGRPFPGLFMSPVADVTQPEAPREDESLTLGQDGQFYIDYHFMVRGVRPLGGTLPEAVASFRKDPILSRLKRGGGVNELIAVYEAMPPEDRPIHDLMSWVGRCSTVSMAGANAFFADEDLAYRLAKRLLVERPD